VVVVGNGQLQNPDGNMLQAMEDRDIFNSSTWAYCIRKALIPGSWPSGVPCFGRAGGMIWFGRASGDPKGHLEAVLLLIQYNKYETLPYYYCTL